MPGWSFCYSDEFAVLNIPLAVVALILFAVALGCWCASWFLKNRQGFHAMTASMFFGAAGFLALMVSAVATHG